MTYTSWRGIVGIVKPTMRPGSLEEFVRLMPKGVGIIPTFIGFNQGTKKEFTEGLALYEDKVAELAALGATVIHPEGGPPLMIPGVKRELEITQAWEDRFNVPVVTSGQTQVEALHAVGAKKVVGATYLTDEVNDVVTTYLTQAGFDVLSMEGMSVPFNEVGNLSTEQVYAHVKRVFLEHPDGDSIFLFGSGWRSLEAIEVLEQDLGVPVVHSVPARVWAIQKRLHVREPVEGYGYLLEEMP